MRVLACSMCSFCIQINAPLHRVGPLEGACSKQQIWSSSMGGTELKKASVLMGLHILHVSMSLWTDRHGN